MFHLVGLIRHLWQCACMLCTLLIDAARFLRCCLRSRVALVAENLFLRKQLVLYQAHQVKPRRAIDATRFALVWLSQWFDWQQALTVVQPETFRQWQRQRFRLFWRGKSRCGRPPSLVEWLGLIRQIGRDNLTWASGISTMHCGLSWTCRSRRAPCASTCPSLWITRRASVCCLNAGGHACAITPRPSSSMAWPWTCLPAVPKPCRPGSGSAGSIGGADPLRMGYRKALRVTRWALLC
jgi:hypothetical protein